MKSRFEVWQEAWDRRAVDAARERPLKGLKVLPQMVGIEKETRQRLRWKSFWWMLSQDHGFHVLKGFLRHPFKYGWNYLRSLWKGKSNRREGDHFLYGVDSIGEFEGLLRDRENVFVLGFSYCHKPFECPDGRFTDKCRLDEGNPVCQQCFIGKAINALPEGRGIPVIIPTVHAIGRRIFEVVREHAGKQVVFLITACEMTLEMFGDWGNMVGIRGIGVRLDGRICNTMEAFKLSERGTKPGLTVVLPATEQRMLRWIQLRAH